MTDTGNRLRYADKLKDPRWQRRRLEIFQRDEWRCTRCGRDDLTLHVHHVEYVGEPWEAPDSVLRTLCEVCHDAHHHGAPLWMVFADRSIAVLEERLNLRDAIDIADALVLLRPIPSVDVDAEDDAFAYIVGRLKQLCPDNDVRSSALELYKARLISDDADEG